MNQLELAKKLFIEGLAYACVESLRRARFD